jgi:hypothetical protein
VRDETSLRFMSSAAYVAVRNRISLHAPRAWPRVVYLSPQPLPLRKDVAALPPASAEGRLWPIQVPHSASRTRQLGGSPRG